jgi:hypothetical protein
MKAKLFLSAIICAVLVTGAFAATDKEKEGAREAREGRDQAAHGRERGNVAGAERGASKAERGAANSGGNRDALKDAKDAREAVQEAAAKHGK